MLFKWLKALLSSNLNNMPQLNGGLGHNGNVIPAPVLSNGAPQPPQGGSHPIHTPLGAAPGHINGAQAPGHTNGAPAPTQAPGPVSGQNGSNVSAPKRGRGVLQQQQPGMRVPMCGGCDQQIRWSAVWTCCVGLTDLMTNML